MPTIIIPARYESKRFPGKALALVRGVPMVRRVYESCVDANVGPVYVATDDRRIADVLPQDSVLMTSPDHENGTERCEEASTSLGLMGAQLVMNVQGDMPFIAPRFIKEFAKFLAGVAVGPLATAVCTNPNYKGSVRAAMDDSGKALFFSRCFSQGLPHVGVYGYSALSLRNYAVHGPSSLEHVESLEQMRWLAKGIGKMHVWQTDIDPGPEINTPEDLIEVNI